MNDNLTTIEDTLFVDLETTAPVDINAPGSEYHRAATVTHYVWARGLDAPSISDDPTELAREMRTARAVVMHNLRFDLAVLMHAPCCAEPFGDILRERILPDSGDLLPVDSMAMADLLNLPAALDTLVSFLRVGQKQDYDFEQESKLKFDLFATDESRAAQERKLREYALNDVVIMRAAYRRMLPHVPLTEMQTLVAHSRINARGVTVDRDRARELIGPAREKTLAIGKRFTDLTGCDPNKPAHFVKWLKRNGHPEVDSARKENLIILRSFTTRPKVKQAIDIRGEYTESDAKKLETILSYTDPDGQMRFPFRHAFAATGRWSSRGAQIQNLKATRNGGQARKAIVARPGHTLWHGDYKNIEFRVGLWLAGHLAELAELHAGADIYLEVARKVYGSHVTKGDPERHKGKLVVLSAQYGTGLARIKDMLNLDTEVEAKDLRDGFHERFPGFRKMWQDLERAVAMVLTSKDGAPVHVGEARFERGDGPHGNLSAGTLSMVLPSGRRVLYRHPQQTEDGLFQFTARWVNGKPHRRDISFGGKMLNNLCQSYARDFLARALTRFAADPEVQVVGHVHDSIVAEISNERATPETRARLEQLMAPAPGEAPDGLLLDVESAYHGDWS